MVCDAAYRSGNNACDPRPFFYSLVMRHRCEWRSLDPVNGRWAISVDVEGFSKNYEHSEARKSYAILALGELMRSVYHIGTLCYPGTLENNFSERLFAHQFGDGFLVCSDFPEADASRAIAVAVAIMRNMILNGYATKAAISAGDMSDIRGCYPHPMRDAENERLDLGMGLMTVISVMGTALTKAHKLAATQTGAVLVLDDDLAGLGLPPGLKRSGSLNSCVDWISSDLPLADEIATKAGFRNAGAEQLLVSLKAYCEVEPKPPSSWKEATFSSVCQSGA